MVEITVLAVTRFSDGACAAGVTSDGKWIRPTRPNPRGWRQLEYSDCKESSGRWIIRKGNVVRINLVKPIPEGAHSEDWLVGNKKPELVRELSEQDYINLCKKSAEDSLESIKGSIANRSLIMVHPDFVKSFSFGFETDWEGDQKYIPRCSFQLGEIVHLNVGITDAEWRGYGRKYLKDGSGCQRFKSSDIFADTATKDCWFTLGANRVKSTDYLLVVGIHLFPVRHFEMDFER